MRSCRSHVLHPAHRALGWFPCVSHGKAMSGLDPALLSCNESDFLSCLILYDHKEHKELFTLSA